MSRSKSSNGTQSCDIDKPNSFSVWWNASWIRSSNA